MEWLENKYSITQIGLGLFCIINHVGYVLSEAPHFLQSVLFASFNAIHHSRELSVYLIN